MPSVWLEEHWTGSHTFQDLAWFCPKLQGTVVPIDYPFWIILHIMLKFKIWKDAGGRRESLSDWVMVQAGGGLAKHFLHPPKLSQRDFAK